MDARSRHQPSSTNQCNPDPRVPYGGGPGGDNTRTWPSGLTASEM